MTDATLQAIGTERVRLGFGPPSTVIIYRCPVDGTTLRLVKNWRGPAPVGAVIADCGHAARIGG